MSKLNSWKSMPGAKEKRVLYYHCTSCGVDSHGNGYGREWPTCDCCDSDILEPVFEDLKGGEKDYEKLSEILRG